ncbi:TrbC/VirB2 family protein [Cupriavidus gilardii]|nr:TrbC/VirB2 family protein [Cupriavidus gilardii]
MHINVNTLVRKVRNRIARNGRRAYQGLSALAGIRRWSTNLTLSRVWAVLVLSTYAGLAAAQSSAPWEAGLCGVAGWFKGPTMLAVGTIAFGAAALGFVFGEEMTGILKKVTNIVAAVALAIGGSAFMGWVAVKAGATASTCPV